MAHLDEHPIGDREYPPLSMQEPDESVILAGYGTTLVAAAATPTRLLLLQLGDGDILTVSPDGVVGRPLGPSDDPYGFETASLAQGASAAGLIRIAVSSGESAPLVILATDGYANSFQDDAGFIAVGKDLWQLIGEHGIDWVGDELPGWLRRASVMGSGDDISVGLMVMRPGPPGTASTGRNRMLIAILLLAAFVFGGAAGIGISVLFGIPR